MGTICNGMAYGVHDGSAYDDPDLKRERQKRETQKSKSFQLFLQMQSKTLNSNKKLYKRQTRLNYPFSYSLLKFNRSAYRIK